MENQVIEAIKNRRTIARYDKTILPAGYEGFSKESWSDLMQTRPMAAQYMDVLYRTYGWYNVAFGVTTTLIAVTAFRRGDRWAWWALLLGNTITLVSAIIYDKRVNAIGPFELTEYLGLVMVWGACAVTAPFLRRGSGAQGREPRNAGFIRREVNSWRSTPISMWTSPRGRS